MPHPHLFVTAEKTDGLCSVDDLRRRVASGHSGRMWETIMASTDADRRRPPLLPASALPGRSKTQIDSQNRDWTVCEAAGQRVLRAALASLVTGEPRYRDAALTQARSLFEASEWEDWRDKAHQSLPADLRTGTLCHYLGLAYDWLHPMLAPPERQWFIDGLDRRGIQPFLQSVREGAWWTETRNNWLTCIVGGLGVAGMALGDEHPEARFLVDYALPRMRGYLDIYGPEGEFNESVAYSNATRAPVDFFTALRYHTGGVSNRVAKFPFPEACRWFMYMTAPPGRNAAFGDSKPLAVPRVAFCASVADATRDGVLQWFYLEHCDRVAPLQRDLPRELLSFDPDLEPLSPEGRLPRAHAFRAEGGCVSSRTDWNPHTTHSLVFAKGGHGYEAHGHHDAGQVVVDGGGERLIVDLGSPSNYPADFFAADARHRYHNAGVWGHNVLAFDEEETRGGTEDRAELLAAGFDDERGGYWVHDLGGVYEHAERVRRTVVHLLPGTVAVLDEARLDAARAISLRWHTADRCEPEQDGSFTVTANDVRLAARVVCLDAAGMQVRRGEHAYEPPFDRGRLGEPLEQRHETYVEAFLKTRACRLLTMFQIFAPGEDTSRWQGDDGRWTIATPGGTVEVTCREETLRVGGERREWTVPQVAG